MEVGGLPPHKQTPRESNEGMSGSAPKKKHKLPACRNPPVSRRCAQSFAISCFRLA
jgi:hypothetical protein